MADEMVQKLPNDIIVKMVMRLPLKYALQCRVLNKYFYNNISLPKLLTSTNPPIIFHESRNHRLTIISCPLRKSTTLPNKVSILNSCNGVLLLDCRWLVGTKHYVFNPLTGGLKLLNCDIHCWELVGLAISVPEKPSSSLSSTFDFKLVELQIVKSYRLEPFTRLWFRVHVPSHNNNNNDNFEKKSFYLDYHGSFRTHHLGAVYAHGCVHWLGADAVAIAAFDVETEWPTIMDGPLRNARTGCPESWFGLSQGSLQYIVTTMSLNIEMVVHKHNYATQEWCVAHKIPIGEQIRKSFSGRYPTPVFFDGQNVFFHIWKWIRGSLMEEIHVYDLSIGEWKMSGQVDHGAYNHRYMEFVPTIARVSDPTTARVSDGYLTALKRSARLQPTLRRLQQILLGGS